MQWLCALSIALAACAGTTSAETTRAETTSAETTSAETTSAETTSASGTASGSPAIGDVTLTRSGGLAGLLSTVTVRPDGSVLVTNDSEMIESVLDSNDLQSLHTLVGSPEFAALSQTYVPAEGVCCDFFFYTVTSQIGDRTLESTTADTIDTPPALQQVIDLLIGLSP